MDTPYLCKFDASYRRLLCIYGFLRQNTLKVKYQLKVTHLHILGSVKRKNLFSYSVCEELSRVFPKFQLAYIFTTNYFCGQLRIIAFVTATKVIERIFALYEYYSFKMILFVLFGLMTIMLSLYEYCVAIRFAYFRII